MPIELNPIDRHFARFLAGRTEAAPPWFEAVAALASRAVGDGHVCLNLSDLAGLGIEIDGRPQLFPPLDELLAGLRPLCAVGAPGDFAPLVLDGGRLYLCRYWRYEQELIRFVAGKAAAPPFSLDEEVLAAGLDRLLPPDGDGTDWQRVAALAALRQRFCIISGGPGTGKTATVVRLLALLLEQPGGDSLRVALAAPTGKAAARLKEALRQGRETIAAPAATRALIPDEVTTIHRLLGPVRDSIRFRHGEGNPLAADVVIVDEASMVSLPLMAKLAQALKPEARLVLVGDRDQLASVEAGAVLGDLCGGRRPVFSPDFAALAQRVADADLPAATAGGPLPLLADSLVVFERNFRFGAGSAIGAVSRAVNAGAGEEALALMREGEGEGAVWRDLADSGGLTEALTPAVLDGYGPYLRAASPAPALELFARFRLLCALRRGPFGVEGLNRLIEALLARAGLIDPGERWYRGRPVLVTANDPRHSLYNGDIGLVFPDPAADDALRVFFPTVDGGVRSLSPASLPPHETAYAMTVHKSQGSEFDRVLIVLPDRDAPVLSRELVYTGLTRARSAVELLGREEVFLAAVGRRVERVSGLGPQLWGEDEGDGANR